MCYAIYAAFILIFAVYSDYLLDTLVLSTRAGGDNLIAIAVGWEIVPAIWPLLLMAALVSSVLTYAVTRRMLARGKEVSSGSPAAPGQETR